MDKGKIDKLIIPKEVYDNTTLTNYDRCERYGFFKHERHWEREGRAAPLGMGVAWHSGQDVLWPVLVTMTEKAIIDSIDYLVDLAMSAFMDRWEAEGMPMNRDLEEAIASDKAYKARNPDVAALMYNAYILEHASFFPKIELLAIEQPFIVPIFETRDDVGYIGLMDKNFRHWIDGVVVLDHKTTTSFAKLGGLRLDFMESFAPNSQFTGYLYAMNILYPEHSPIDIAWADVSLVHKDVGDGTSHDTHRFIPIRSSNETISEWIQDTRIKIERIQESKHRLSVGKHAFPKKTSSCTTRGLCPFMDICNGSSNWAEMNIPSGFVESHWSPISFLED